MKFQKNIRHDILTDLETFFKRMNLDLTRIDYRLDVGTSISIDQEINPIEFLEFAENDLARGDKQALVNALSNAKRAIDSQVDMVFLCFGINKRRNFPKKCRCFRK